MRRKRITKEEKVAQALLQEVNDLTLDLDLTGVYIAQMSPAILYNRLQEVADSARYAKETDYDGFDTDYVR
jgi:hypothetical protein